MHTLISEPHWTHPFVLLCHSDPVKTSVCWTGVSPRLLQHKFIHTISSTPTGTWLTGQIWCVALGPPMKARCSHLTEKKGCKSLCLFSFLYFKILLLVVWRECFSVWERRCVLQVCSVDCGWFFFYSIFLFLSMTIWQFCPPVSVDFVPILRVIFIWFQEAFVVEEQEVVGDSCCRKECFSSFRILS